VQNLIRISHIHCGRMRWHSESVGNHCKILCDCRRIHIRVNNEDIGLNRKMQLKTDFNFEK